jgi:hypothetical protein
VSVLIVGVSLAIKRSAESRTWKTTTKWSNPPAESEKRASLCAGTMVLKWKFGFYQSLGQASVSFGQ